MTHFWKPYQPATRDVDYVAVVAVAVVVFYRTVVNIGVNGVTK
jgi:hypothetical protein